MTKKLTTALFFPSPKLSGAEKRFINMAYMLNKRDVVNTFLYISENAYKEGLTDPILAKRLSSLNHSNLIKPIRTLEVKPIIFNLIYCYIQLLFRLIKDRVDVFHFGSGLIYLIPFLKIIRFKAIYEITSPDIADYLNKRSVFFLKSIDVYNAVSLSVYNRIINIGENKNDYLFSKLRYNKTPFYIPSDEITEVYQKQKLILFCSRFIERKNPILFLKAGVEILKNHPEYKLTMLGDGPLTSSLNELATSSGVGERISIYRTSKPSVVFKSSEVYISLIEPDNVPSQSAMEALDFGNILIVSNTGNSNIFVENNNGFLTPLDQKDLVRFIEKTITLPIVEKRNMAINSKKLLNKRFSPNDFLGELELVYKKDSL